MNLNTGDSSTSVVRWLTLHSWTLNCQSRRLDSIQFLCSRAHILAGWRLETQLTLLNWNVIYNHFALPILKTQPLYWCEGVFTVSLQQWKLLDCSLRIRCSGNVITESLPSNELLFWLHYSYSRESCHNIVTCRGYEWLILWVIDLIDWIY
jgi:hypothetical protein